MKREQLKIRFESPHPAALWASGTPLDPLQVDCVTAVMLKILDHKCKMAPEEQMALMAVYSVVKERQGLLLDKSVHEIIENALHTTGSLPPQRIHELRLHAEATIPKPVMKHFKQFLRESLYGV